MRSSSFAPLLAVSALVACADPEPIITSIPVTPCASSPAIDELEVMVQGTVVDLVTRAPQAGVTVDVARAWEPEAVFPGDSCSLARLTTDADGRFGPLAVKVGPRPSLLERKFVVLLVQGGEVSPTASDAAVPTGSMGVIDRVIEAPSLALIDGWRAELDDGGMDGARTRGLIAFRYEDAAGLPAAGVVAQHATFLDYGPLDRGREVRYVAADLQTITPSSRATTTEAGLALIGVLPSVRGTRDIGGERGADDWGSVGCLVGEGWTFFEESQPIVR